MTIEKTPPSYLILLYVRGFRKGQHLHQKRRNQIFLYDNRDQEQFIIL